MQSNNISQGAAGGAKDLNTILKRRRRDFQIQKNEETPSAASIAADIVSQTAVSAAHPSYPLPVIRQATMADIRNEYGLVSLGDLTIEHMSDGQRGRYEAVLSSVRKWVAEAKHTAGIGFMLSSQQVGVGKTSIAKAVFSSFCSIYGDREYVDDEPQFRVEIGARMYTARDLMALLAPKKDKPVDLWKIASKHIRYLILDDVGREGKLAFVAKDDQAIEIQSRYFHLINWLYETRRNGRYPVSVFITTNLTPDATRAMLGEATWSRLIEMCKKGYIVELVGIGDYRLIAGGRAI